jgi:hypothetical protein
LVSFGNSTTIQVYPTLAKEHMQLFVGGISPERVSIELFDNKGSLVYKTKLYSNSFILPHLLPGIYHIKFIDINDQKVAGSTQILIY